LLAASIGSRQLLQNKKYSDAMISPKQMDVAEVRKDFPLYSSEEKRSIYLDSACQSLRPRQVIAAQEEYYTDYPACGGRSVHHLATQVSIKVDEARENIAAFFNAHRMEEIVFTKNCTEALNLVAKGLDLRRDDVILTTDIEHNSNHVPWLQLQKAKGIRRRFVKTPESGLFDIEAFKAAMSREVKVVSVVHTNNVSGTSVPVKTITEIAHEHGAIVLIDGAQAAPHKKVDVNDLDVDFYAASVHKMLGPSGLGILYGRQELLAKLDPLISGGGGVSLTDFDRADYLPPPERFEAGLMNYSGVIGAGAAVGYLMKLGMEEVEHHDRMLNHRATSKLKDVPALSLITPIDADHRGSILSFNIRGMASHDVAMVLDEIGEVMVRSGMHCVHPFFLARGMNGCVRASFYIYNTLEECDRFAELVTVVASRFST
jgi:cysteine desulfurase/selenocysteine lyase